jgi:hypothetical protein
MPIDEVTQAANKAVVVRNKEVIEQGSEASFRELTLEDAGKRAVGLKLWTGWKSPRCWRSALSSRSRGRS